MTNKQTTDLSCTLIFIAFLVLKVLDKVDWSWWFVTAPLWIGPVVAICSALVYIVGGLGVVMLRHFRAKRKRRR
jgi:hypothetical protein